MIETPRVPLTESEISRRTNQIFIEETAARLRRDRLLTEITGLSRHDFHTWDRRATVTGAQAEKIAGLRIQMTQMKRGYERKIARLQKRILEVGAAVMATSIKTPGPARGFLDRNGNPTTREVLIAEQDAAIRKETTSQATEPSQEQVQAMVDVWRVWSTIRPGLRPSVNELMRKAYRTARDMKTESDV